MKNVCELIFCGVLENSSTFRKNFTFFSTTALQILKNLAIERAAINVFQLIFFTFFIVLHFIRPLLDCRERTNCGYFPMHKRLRPNLSKRFLFSTMANVMAFDKGRGKRQFLDFFFFSRKLPC